MLQLAPLLLATLLVGCRPDSADSGGPEPDPEPADCAVPQDPEAVFGTIESRSTGTSTVFEIRWEATGEDPAWIEYWHGDDEIWKAPGRGPGSALLVGLKPDTSYQYRVVAAMDDELLCSAPASLTTGPLDPGLPTFQRLFHDPGLASREFSVVTLRGSTQGSWAVILDADAEIVWARRADPIRTWLSLDRQALLTNDSAYDPGEAGRITRLPLDGGPPEELEVVGAHMDFVEVEPGVYATFGWDLREFLGGTLTLAGETIMEVSAGQEPRVVWSVFDAVDPDLEKEWPVNASWSVEASDWSHLNHLHYAPEEGAYYATSRFLDQVYRVDRATGETTWVLGPGGGDFTPLGGDVAFDPHSAEPTESGLLVFDTGTERTEHCSAISEFTLDTEAWTVTPGLEYHTEDCLVTAGLGNATLLENGNRMLVLALNGQVDEITAKGELASRWTVPGGMTLGYVTREASLYP